MLNIRIAERLVAAGIVAHDAMRDELTKLLVDKRPLRRYDREASASPRLQPWVKRAHP
jgi:hypothetical protein